MIDKNSRHLNFFSSSLEELDKKGNLRVIPPDTPVSTVDFTSNDYLGLGGDRTLREEFFSHIDPASLPLTSSASRLLAGNQQRYSSLEKTIEVSYDNKKEALLFNSGYHANTGIIPAIAGRSDIILADRLVHASIIDGIRLSGAEFLRFPHNDITRLALLLEKYRGRRIIVIVESIYSMDGDRADLRALTDLKKNFPEILLYVDEAHAVGVSGPGGLGEAMAQQVLDEADIIVGTFGKALASSGAFVLAHSDIKRYLVNKCRSLIFSTALSPLTAAWSEFTWKRAGESDSLREKLAENGRLLAGVIPGGEASHIRPLIVGDADKAVKLSSLLSDFGFNVLPIRTPTVPPHTERLRFSLSASINSKDIERLGQTLNRIT